MLKGVLSFSARASLIGLAILCSAQTIAADGTTSGVFEVTPTGAATYAIPISVPPGTAGLAPQLSLVYTSQGGDDLVGLGWQLGGLPRISRCPATSVHDGFIDGVDFDSNDRLCLGGERLMAVSGQYGISGTEYRTELNDFSKVVQNNANINSPSTTFTVETKSGLIYEYGGSNASLNAPGRAGNEIYTWAVREVRDRSGNYFTVNYDSDADTHEYMVENVLYGGNKSGTPAYNEVRFAYESRTSALRRYLPGGSAQIITTKRLKSITTFADSSKVREYQLGYEASNSTARSRLSSITECGYQNYTLDCLAPTEISYIDSGNGFIETSGLELPGLLNSNGELRGELIDVNGDGLPDWVQAYAGGQRATWINQKTGWQQSYHYRLPTNIYDGAERYGQFVDVNSDGLPDWVASKYDSDSGSYVAQGTYLNTGTGWDSSENYSLPARLYDGLSQQGEFVDLNGDNRIDFVFSSVAGNTAYINTGDGWQANSSFSLPTPLYYDDDNKQRGVFADVNADGLADYVVAYKDNNGGQRTTYINNGSQWTTSTTSMNLPVDIFDGPAQLGQFTDVNNDGLVDFILAYDEYTILDNRPLRTGRKTYINVGDGWQLNTEYSPPAGLFNYLSNTQVAISSSKRNGLIADINGDGLSDFVSSTGDTTGTRTSLIETWLNGSGTYCTPNPCGTLWLSLGSDTRFHTPDTLFVDGTPAGIVSDIDGNGAADWVFSYNINGQSSQDTYANKAGISDLLNGITNGLGAAVNVEYSLLTDPMAYTKSKSFVPNHQSIVGALAVVSAKENSNGLRDMTRQEYKYRQGLVDLSGRGFRGFEYVTVSTTFEDTTKNTTKETRYNLEFPFTGIPRTIIVNDTTGRVIKEISNYPLSRDTGGGTQFPYIDIKTVRINKLAPGFGVDSFASYTNEYDDYGNLTSETQIVSAGPPGFYDNFRTDISNVYENNASNWLIGLLKQKKTKKTAPTGEFQTRTETYEYKPYTRLVSDEFVEPGSAIELHTHYGYDLFGNATQVSVSGFDIATRSTTTTYDARGQFPKKITNAMGHSENHSHSPRHGGRLSLIGPNQLTTQWGYDAFGREILESRADGTSTSTNYSRVKTGTRSECGPSPTGGYRVCELLDEYGFKIKEVNSDGSGSILITDVIEREIRSAKVDFTGDLTLVQTSYDPQGNVRTKAAPCKSPLPSGILYDGSSLPYCGQIFETVYKYDLRGRVIEQNAPSDQYTPTGNITTINYNGSTVTTTDPKSNVSSKKFDAIGQITRSTDANGYSTTYEYDPFGNLVKTTDHNGNVVSITYDIRGRKKSMADPDMGNWTYDYDVLGQLKGQTDAKGQTVSIEYDLLGRKTKRTDAGGIDEWYYDSQYIGSLDSASRTDNRSSSAYDSAFFNHYDDFGRIHTSGYYYADTWYGVLRSYDSQSRLDELTYPGGLVVKHHYNDYGYLDLLTNATTGSKYWELKDVDVFGNSAVAEYGNGHSTVRSYDAARGHLDAILTGTSPGTEVQSLRYEWDAVGNLELRTDANQNGLEERFYYDSINRLDYSTLNGATNLELEYDEIGNITSKSGVGDYHYDGPQPHAVSSVTETRPASYSYDANGNIISGAGRSITWNAFNKPELISDNGNHSALTYGSDRKRVLQVVTGVSFSAKVYVADIYELHFTNEGVTEERSHVRAGNQVVATDIKRDNGTQDTLYMHRDHLGSVDVITDASGAIMERLAFDAFGKRRIAADWSDDTSDSLSSAILATFRGFTGHEHLDAVGLIHMNGRVYDPVLGRFTSPDPFVQSPGSTQSFNRYTYVGNNPLSVVDPSGFFGELTIQRASLGNTVGGSPLVIPPITGGTITSPVFGNTIGGGFGGGFGSIPSVGGYTPGLIGSLGQISATYSQASTASGNPPSISGPSSQLTANNYYIEASSRASSNQVAKSENDNRVEHGQVAGVVSLNLSGSKNGPNSLSFSQALQDMIEQFDVAQITARRALGFAIFKAVPQVDSVLESNLANHYFFGGGNDYYLTADETARLYFQGGYSADFNFGIGSLSPGPLGRIDYYDFNLYGRSFYKEYATALGGLIGSGLGGTPFDIYPLPPGRRP